MGNSPIAFDFSDLHNLTFDIESSSPVKPSQEDSNSVALENFNSNVDIQNILPGLESQLTDDSEWNSSNPLTLKEVESFRMKGCPQENTEGTKLHVRCTDGVNFRIYINGDTFISSPTYINKFSQFMRSRSSGETVTIHLGVMMYGLHLFNIGSILDAMLNCKAKVTTFAGGHCGCPESVIWLHGHSRVFGNYGVLQFDGGLFLDEAPFFKHYFATLMNRAKELNILTDDQVQSILKDNKTIYVYPK